MDQTVRAYDISSDKVRCMMSLRHDHYISSLALSPDNSLLAVGGQSSEITIWSVRDQKLLRSFYLPQVDVEMDRQSEEDPLSKQVFDLNWSSEGAVIAAGIEKQVVILDIR